MNMSTTKNNKPVFNANAVLKNLTPENKAELFKALLDEQSEHEKDQLYRKLWIPYVMEDVKSHADDIGTKLTEYEITKAADLYVYHGKYDCNLTYWDNIESLIEIVTS